MVSRHRDRHYNTKAQNLFGVEKPHSLSERVWSYHRWSLTEFLTTMTLKFEEINKHSVDQDKRIEDLREK